MRKRLSHHTDKDLNKEFPEVRAWKLSSVGLLPPLLTDL